MKGESEFDELIQNLQWFTALICLFSKDFICYFLEWAICTCDRRYMCCNSISVLTDIIQLYTTPTINSQLSLELLEEAFHKTCVYFIYTHHQHLQYYINTVSKLKIHWSTSPSLCIHKSNQIPHIYVQFQVNLVAKYLYTDKWKIAC